MKIVLYTKAPQKKSSVRRFECHRPRELGMLGPRFQNWDLRIRPLGGDFTVNPIFNSKIVFSYV